MTKEDDQRQIDNILNRTLSTAQVANALGLTIQAIIYMVNQGKLECVKIGRTRRIYKHSLRTLQSSRE